LGLGVWDLILKLRAHKPVRGPLMAIVAMSPDIRTRTLRSLYTAIKPSRMLTLRTADCLHSSLVTKNFRSISTGPCCSCSFSRSDFSRTDIHRVDGTRAASLSRSTEVWRQPVSQARCQRRPCGLDRVG